MISCENWCFSTPLRSWICPSRDLWRTLEWSSCTNHHQPRVCTWLQPRIWWEESPWCRCFWRETRLQRSLTCTASARIQVFPWAALTQPQWTAGVAAMSIRSTLGCGNSDVASHAWVVCQLRQLKKGCRLTGMQVKSVELSLVGCARRNANDSKWTGGVLMNLNCAYTLHILVYTSLYYSENRIS